MNDINRFILISIVIGLIFAVTSNILIVQTMEINQAIEEINIAIVVIIVFLLSANITLIIKRNAVKTHKKTTTLGFLTGILTTACPICQPIWLFWLGLGSATAFLADVSAYIGIISIALLSFSLYNSMRSTNQCEVKLHGKNNQS